MKNRPILFLFLALVALVSCTSQSQNSEEESYKDDVFLKLLADSSGIVEERLLSADGKNGFVYYYQFYNLLPVDIAFTDEDLKNMSDYYNFNLVSGSSFTGYDTYYRARFSLESDSLELLNSWIANVDSFHNCHDFYNQTIHNRLESALEARVEVLRAGNAENVENRDTRLYVDDIVDIMTKWFPLNDVGEGERDSVWAELNKKLSPQNYLPKDFPDIYQTFFNMDTTIGDEKKAKLFECYNSAKDFDEKTACLFTLIGTGIMKHMDRDTLETLVREAEAIFESATYTPMLPILWRAYRCLYNDLHSCPSKDCYCFNQRYNYYKRLVAYTYLRHIQAFPDDDTAKIQFCFLCCTDDILKDGEYPYGNQSAAERIFLFWKRSVL